MSSEDSELLNWKSKYYDALGELESKEKAWLETEQFLRQGLSRLSLVADDSNEVLNRQLEQLRTLLRSSKNEQQLRELLDSVSSSIRQLDEQRKIRKQQPRPAEILEELLGKIDFPRGLGHRAKALQKKMLQAGDDDHRLLIKELADFIVEALHWVEEDAPGVEQPATEKTGLLGKLFHRDEKTTEETSAPDREDAEPRVAKKLLREIIQGLIEPVDRRELMLKRNEQGRRERDIYALGHELVQMLKPMLHEDVAADISTELPAHEILLQLLERMDIPAHLSDKVEHIKEMLIDATDVVKMEQAIRAIAELISEMRNQVQEEKSEMEAFLVQMDVRLQEIGESFEESNTLRQESYKDGQELDTEVSRQVEGIEASVSQAQDLPTLKTALQQRVDTIRGHLQAFRDAETERLEKAERQVKYLSGRLQTVQQESNVLRERIKRERDLAMIDPLTGIANRFAYNERLAQEVARWKRYNSPLVLAIWDVDFFKKINDSYGHQAGDKVLSVIAKVFRDKVRETDFIARFGGEEFVLLLPETDLEKASIVAEHLRKAVEDCEFHYRGEPVSITISCGFTQFREGDTAEQVFARADAALYKAKENGRNQCRSA